jgi:hypothetical protein
MHLGPFRRRAIASATAFACAIAFAMLAVLQTIPASHAAGAVRGVTCTVRGTKHDDVLRGTNASDRICGFGGNDIVLARGGADVVLGGDGSDRAWGGAGDDKLLGGNGLDALLGGLGSDVLFGGTGQDSLIGGAGTDSMYGGRGSNRCPGQSTELDLRCSTTSGPPVVVAAGDIACAPGYTIGQNSCHEKAVADRMAKLRPWAVLTLGDNQYEEGTYTAYERSYARSWGRLKAITYPAPGNHEYLTRDASGYYRYFGPLARRQGGRGYYSFELGMWHMIALNSNCSLVGGCDYGDKEYRWLRHDLEHDGHRCTLAYWHHPRFSAGEYSNNTDFTPFWHELYSHGAEIVLNGHDHNYQRYAPLDPKGHLSARGIREFVVGTGGRNRYPVVHATVIHRQYWNDKRFGVLKLVLSSGSYTWKFVTVGGNVLDSGTGACHG